LDGVGEAPSPQNASPDAWRLGRQRIGIVVFEQRHLLAYAISFYSQDIPWEYGRAAWQRYCSSGAS
jgi:hypothetical protein